MTKNKLNLVTAPVFEELPTTVLCACAAEDEQQIEEMQQNNELIKQYNEEIDQLRQQQKQQDQLIDLQCQRLKELKQEIIRLKNQNSNEISLGDCWQSFKEWIWGTSNKKDSSIEKED